MSADWPLLTRLSTILTSAVVSLREFGYVSGPSPSARTNLTAHQHRESLGWATITHPFHPLKGQRFWILKTRHFSGQDTLILQGTTQGTVTVLRDWTDQASPSIQCRANFPSPLLHDVDRLLELAELVRDLAVGRTDTYEKEIKTREKGIVR